MSRLSPEARAIVDASRGGFEPAEADRVRVRRSLAIRLGLAVAAGTAATSAGSTAAGSTLTAILGSTSGKVILALLVVASTGASYHLLARRRPAAAPAAALPAPVASVQPAVSSQRVEMASAPSASAPAASAPVERPATPQSAENLAPAPPTSNGLEQEVARLRRAQEALRDGKPERAMSELQPSESDVLAEERAAMNVFTLCEMGKASEARAAAQSFLAKYPKSPQAPRVRATCAGP